MTLEDFTTFTKVGTKIYDILANSFWHRAERRTTSYLYKDKGENYFRGDFEHLTKIKGDFNDNKCIGAVWMLSNHIGDMKEHEINNWEYIAVVLTRNDPDFPNPPYMKYLRLWYVNTEGVKVIDSMVSPDNTWRYFKIKRVGATLTCDVYSDSDRLNWVAQLSIECPITEYRYIYACCTFNDNSGLWYSDNDIANFELSEPLPIPEPEPPQYKSFDPRIAFREHVGIQHD